jgi:glycosyltransferase involved in cell wall biosynthesis
MKIIEINTVDFGSTGKIALSIASEVISNGGESVLVCGYRNSKISHKNTIVIGNKFYKYICSRAEIFFGRHSWFFKQSTRKVIKIIKRMKPDIIHIHNLHGFYINAPLLFNFIKKHNINVVWTLHDCWSFTGRCPHFIGVNCNKWKTGCHHCEYPKEKYPKVFLSNTHNEWERKKKYFTRVEKLTIVTPSNWLASCVKQSFLNIYPVQVINNGIDLETFKRIPSESFRQKYGVVGQFVILGVSFGWGLKKGLDIFIDLSKRLDSRFSIILVGTDENVDNILPKNIISIHKTQNQSELAEFYSNADIFLNPTREDTFPTVNLEALACGCPIITSSIGGASEMVDDKTGIALKELSVDHISNILFKLISKNPYSKEDCIEHAKRFDKKDRFGQYIQLFNKIINN